MAYFRKWGGGEEWKLFHTKKSMSWKSINNCHPSPPPHYLMPPSIAAQPLSIFYPVCHPHSLGGGSIADLVPTHVLQNLFTVVVLVATRVLIGPLDRQDWTLIVVEATHVVSTTIVVLGVKKSKWIKIKIKNKNKKSKKKKCIYNKCSISTDNNKFRILSVVAQQISVLWKQKNHVPVCIVQAIVQAPLGQRKGEKISHTSLQLLLKLAD